MWGSCRVAVCSADAEKLAYVAEHLPRVLRRLKCSEETWHVRMAGATIEFAKLLKSNSRVSRTARKELVAALYHLGIPFDVIPDNLSGKVYADDALVLITCLLRLRRLGIDVLNGNGNSTRLEEDSEG